VRTYTTSGIPTVFLIVALAFVCLAAGLWWKGFGALHASVALAAALGSSLVALVHHDADA
jgi:hypothetical protein